MLSVLAGEPLHGYLIIQRLRLMPMFRNHSPDPTGVYRLLKAMESRNLVVCEWNTPERGPARKQFRITARGVDCLGKWIATMEEYAMELGGLLQALKAGPNRATRASKCSCRTPRTSSREPGRKGKSSAPPTRKVLAR
jgi:DNA-binding PadR family transcriptional regulator